MATCEPPATARAISIPDIVDAESGRFTHPGEDPRVSLKTAVLSGASLAALLIAPATLSAASIKSVEFIGMEAPKTAADMARIYSTAQAKVTYSDGSEKTFPLHYEVLYRNIDRIGSNPYEAGRLYDAFGQGLIDPLGKPVISESPDGSTLVTLAGQPGAPNGDPTAYHLVQWEADWLLSDGSVGSKAEGWYPRMPMIMNRNVLAQDRDTGKLRVIDQANVDFADVGGLWIPCAASPTPWGTHLAGEEDYDLFDRSKVDASLAGLTELYFGNTRQATPYGYGYPVEVSVGRDGKTSVKKHYSMGRASWELARVMPDGKTVYYGDDGRYTGLFMYVADRAGNLGAGTLYAARWDQQSDQNGGSAKLTWIKLGHASDYEVEAMIEQERFSSSESTVLEFADEAKPGFTTIKAGLKAPEHIKLRPGKEHAAAFLESRRYAAMRGATTEFNKMEGVTVDPQDRKVYIAMSRIEEGMLANADDPADHIKLPKLGSGGVYALTTAAEVKDSEGNPIASEWAAVSMAGVPGLMGVDLAESDALGNTSDPEHIAEPDNIAFLPGMRTLFIDEDSGRHTNNFSWAFNVDTGKLARVLSAPVGAELTGLNVLPDWNGFAYVLTSFQHQGDGIADSEIKDDNLKAELQTLIDPFVAVVGYLGGLPGTGGAGQEFAAAE
jgi:secreted PhoX family phosphatase